VGSGCAACCEPRAVDGRSLRPVRLGAIRLRRLRTLLVGRRAGAALGLAVLVVLVPVSSASTATASGLLWSAPVLIDRAATESGGIAALSCPAVSLCVGFDSTGHLVTSKHPAVIGSWRTVSLPGAARLPVAGVSCPSVSFCIALASTDSGAGRAFVSSSPARGPGAWRIVPVRVADDPTAIACPSSGLCVGVEGRGNVVSSSAPEGGPDAWHVARVDSRRSLDGDAADLVGVSCPSVSLCLAVDDAGNILSSNNPTGGPGAWKLVHLFNAQPGEASVACASDSMCAVAAGGRILTSDDPSGGRSAWVASGGSAGLLTSSVACPAVTFCVANTDFDGGIVTSTAPGDRARRWHHTHVDGTNTINAISCPSASLCAIADREGNVSVGTPTRVSVDVPTVTGHLEFTLVPRRQHSMTIINSHLTIGCPMHGPACTVAGAIRADDPNHLDREIRVGQVQLVIRTAARQRLVLGLSDGETQRLVKNDLVSGCCDLQIIARAGHGLAVADQLLIAIDLTDSTSASTTAFRGQALIRRVSPASPLATFQTPAATVAAAVGCHDSALRVRRF
jgi:hypothetical protein